MGQVGQDSSLHPAVVEPDAKQSATLPSTTHHYHVTLESYSGHDETSIPRDRMMHGL